MGKKAKKKYYAIKEGIEVRNVIVDTWDECSKYVLGYNAVYKSFDLKKDAEEYLKQINVEKAKERNIKGIEAKRIKKATTKTLHINIDKNLYLDFQKKCTEFEIWEDKAIENMIKEWIY